MFIYCGSKKAFTIVELLVVIAIIGMLVALATPRLFRMMEEGRRTQCRSQLRNIGVAKLLYASDHNGWLVAMEERQLVGRNGEYPFTQHILKLNEKGYVTDPATWKCPSDKVNGPGNNIPVFAAKNFDPPFNSVQNASYMYIAGYNISTTREGPSVAPVLADESNDIENGSATPGAMPEIGEYAAHGANFRNVLYLDGSVIGLDSADASNAIFDYIIEPERLQSVD